MQVNQPEHRPRISHASVDNLQKSEKKSESINTDTSSQGSLSSSEQRPKKMADWLLSRSTKASPNPITSSLPSLQKGQSLEPQIGVPHQSLAREAFAKYLMDPVGLAELKAFDQKSKSGFFKKKDKNQYPLHILRFFQSAKMDLLTYGIKGELATLEVPKNEISNFLVFHETYLSANAPALHTITEQTRRYIADRVVFGVGNKLSLDVFDTAIDQIVYTLYREVYQPFLHSKASPTPIYNLKPESHAFASPINSRATSPSMESGHTSLSSNEIAANIHGQIAVPNQFASIFSAEQFDPELNYNRESFVRVLDDVLLFTEFQQYCQVCLVFFHILL
ncbi:hypothetical protein HK096_009055 [Nowakowskiella sp. JEL0078]|nr:hypothetical protein HK096_009055 [Nowakowskiella sp. JEL0078]